MPRLGPSSKPPCCGKRTFDGRRCRWFRPSQRSAGCATTRAGQHSLRGSNKPFSQRGLQQGTHSNLLEVETTMNRSVVQGPEMCHREFDVPSGTTGGPSDLDRQNNSDSCGIYGTGGNSGNRNCDTECRGIVEMINRFELLSTAEISPAAEYSIFIRLCNPYRP